MSFLCTILVFSDFAAYPPLCISALFPDFTRHLWCGFEVSAYFKGTSVCALSHGSPWKVVAVLKHEYHTTA